MLSCADGAGEFELIVELRTDLTPGSEFVGVRTEVSTVDFTSDTGARREEIIATTALDFVSGERVATFESIPGGEVHLRVSTLGPGGEVIVARRVLLVLDEDSGVIVLVTRECKDVVCEPAETCFAGACVDPRCSDANPELCVSECAGDAECGAAPCAEASCVRGACFAVARDDRCDMSELCDPEAGCLPREACDPARCADDNPCTEDSCAPDGSCLNVPMDDRCDDDNPCTDDRCAASGCESTNNAAACDDGLYCNGSDSCADGACGDHEGTPCEMFCNETTRSCEACGGADDCGEITFGEWSECAFDDACAEAGTRSRTRSAPVCDEGMCRREETTEEEACTRVTDGESCGAPTMDAFGACGGFDGPCDQTGRQSREVRLRVCAAGRCETEPMLEEQACARDTDGDSCGADVPGSFGACTGFAGTCDESGTRSRPITRQVCRAGTCLGEAAAPETETCSRSTAGVACRATSAGGWGACNWANVCDEAAQQTRTVTRFACVAQTCSPASSTETRACNRDTDALRCGTTTRTGWGACGFGGDTCASSGAQQRTRSDFNCASGTCRRQNTPEFQSCTRPNRDGISCGAGTQQRCCANACRDTSVDSNHCGGCNLACTSGLSCRPVTAAGGQRGLCGTCSANSQCPPNGAPVATCWATSIGGTGHCQCQSNAHCAPGQLCFTGSGDNYCYYP